jgi:hypothetical protein
MTSHEFDLLQNDTLAPLKEGLYQPVNLSGKDATLLTTISKNLLTNIDLTIGSISVMLSNLKMYKETMIDSINAEAESIDLSTRYASNPPRQTHSLPGVVTLPPSYDLNSIRSDHEKMEQIKDIREKTATQKDLYIKMLEQEFKTFNGNFKKLIYSDSTMSQFIESLNQKTNPNY